jgi:hypothetical protein
MNKWLACALVVVTSGCPDVKTDPDETNPNPIVEFDPGNSIVPFPNNLLIDRTTGRVNLPPGCNETASAKALRELVLNKLDGFGTYQTAMSVTLTAPIDPASVTENNVLLYKIATGTTPVDPSAAQPVPVLVIPGSSVRFGSETRNGDGTLTCADPGLVDSITVVPRVPLDQKSTYAVALVDGLSDSSGKPYGPSFTWALVRQAQNPVTVDDRGTPDPSDDVIVDERTPLNPASAEDRARLFGINLLWNAHAPILTFLEAKGHTRDDVLLAWGFRTQTISDAFDPAVAGSPVSQLNDVAITGPADSVPAPISATLLVNLPASRAALPFSICDSGAGAAAPAEPNDVQCLLKLLIGGGVTLTGGAGCAVDTTGAQCAQAFTVGTISCAAIGCANIGNLLVGRIQSPQFQLNLPNAAYPNNPVPGPWAEPHVTTKVEDEQLSVLITVPTGTAPAAGWPTILFQHALGASRTSVLAAGGLFAADPDGAGAATGFATVAIDAVAHGSRAVRINADTACNTAATSDSSCYAQFLSADLAAVRDHIRQTVIDQLQTFAALKNCTGGADNCGTFRVNPAQIEYVGQSLGGILGGVSVAVADDVQAAVFNVPAVGWVDFFESTPNLDIRCGLVDSLIDAGIVMGAKRDTKDTADPSDDTGACIGDEYKTQPGYRRFSSIARWVFDPGDPANFAARTRTKTSLIQEVVDDQVVPNIATRYMGALFGLTPAAARMNTSATAPTPSPALLTNPTTSKWLQYASIAPNLGAGFPGNTYHHASLLRPAPSVNATEPTQFCSGSTPQYCDGVLGTAQMVVDALTFLQVNK